MIWVIKIVLCFISLTELWSWDSSTAYRHLSLFLTMTYNVLLMTEGGSGGQKDKFWVVLERKGENEYTK